MSTNKPAAKYEYVDVVRLGINAGNARIPRLQRSAVTEFGELLSIEVQRGEWSQDGHSALNAVGQSPEQYLEFVLTTRPHWEIPATVIDAADDTWTSGSLAKQGERWRTLRAHLGSDAVTNAAMAEEAAAYGARFGSTVKGVPPGSAKGEEKPAAGLSSNPWSDRFNGSEEQRLAKMASIIKTGTKFASDMARSAGKTITGAPLKR
jgi:hypothetical protein